MQFSWQSNLLGERGRKCSLDGQRNVQFYRPSNEKKDETQSPLYAPKNSVSFLANAHDAVLQVGEGLSAVSFVKRRYEYAKTATFKSTAGIALLDALNSLKRRCRWNNCSKSFKTRFSTTSIPNFFHEDRSTLIF